jgi:hypothetical protein
MDNNFRNGLRMTDYKPEIEFSQELDIPLIVEDGKNLYLDLFEAMATKIQDGEDVYYHIPQYYKAVRKGEFQILTFEGLPQNIKDLIEDKPL